MWKFALVSTLLLSADALADQYLCVEEKSSGFRYSETQKDWVSAIFKSGNKYTLSNSSGKYELRAPGFEKPVAECSGFNDVGVIFCDGWVKFTLYKKSGRFTLLSDGSYHLVGSEFFPEDSEKVPNPTVSIGKCTSF